MLTRGLVSFVRELIRTLPLDCRAALFTSVFCDPVIRNHEFFEVFAFFSSNLITLRTEAAGQLVYGQDQVARPASELVTPLLEENQGLVAASGHGGKYRCAGEGVSKNAH